MLLSSKEYHKVPLFHSQSSQFAEANIAPGITAGKSGNTLARFWHTPITLYITRKMQTKLGLLISTFCFDYHLPTCHAQYSHQRRTKSPVSLAATRGTTYTLLMCKNEKIGDRLAGLPTASLCNLFAQCAVFKCKIVTDVAEASSP